MYRYTLGIISYAAGQHGVPSYLSNTSVEQFSTIAFHPHPVIQEQECEAAKTLHFAIPALSRGSTCLSLQGGAPLSLRGDDERRIT
jgi:hypothetical protein